MFTLKKQARRFFFGMAVLCAALSVLTACGSKPDTAGGKTITDSMGHEVKVPAKPSKIIATYLEDPLLTLGVKPAAQWSVKETTVQDYLQDQLGGIPTIPYNLPPEAVLSLNPDFIIIGSESQVEKGLYEQYAKIAPTYVIGSQTTGDFRKTLLKMGELLNKTDEANKALAAYDAKAKDTKAKVQAAIGDKKIAILWLTGKNFFVVNGKVASGSVLYGDLGLPQPNVLALIPDAQANWVGISLEKLAQLDADYIFLVNSDKGQAGPLDEDVWRNIPAVKNGQVYEMDSKSSWLYNGVIAGEKVMDDLLKSVAK